jgi:oxygen-independent coproporphyrinogen III oxidase
MAAGIYIHIPFCRQACYYCDFHFSTSLSGMNELVDAIKKEIRLRKEYLPDKKIDTIYFGGGTPSLLSRAMLMDIYEEIDQHFTIAEKAEITLEANPDDLSKEKIKELATTPLNRLSIGIQSFSDVDLKFLNRIHSSQQAESCVLRSQDAGIENITIDLIYGIQTLGDHQWKKNMDQALKLDVKHISAYSLTIEPKTILQLQIQKKIINDVEESKSAQQFELLMDKMNANDFIHYEISNFCKEGFYSKHNSSYWKGVPYIGLGPSAHSYNGKSRQWNVKSNARYIASINENDFSPETEVLTHKQKYNEYILTALRTIWGVSASKIATDFEKEMTDHFMNAVAVNKKRGYLEEVNEKIVLTRSGKLVADRIASELFVV